MNDISVIIVDVRKWKNLAEIKWGLKPQNRTEMITMRLSYYGSRAGDDPADRTRYAVASWKDGYAKDEEMGYIFRCILNDYGYSYEAGTDGKVCFVKIMIADYDEFILIKEFFREAKAAFVKTDIKLPDDNMSN